MEYVSYTGDWDYNYPEKDKPTFIAYYDEFRVGRNREEVDIKIISVNRKIVNEIIEFFMSISK